VAFFVAAATVTMTAPAMTAAVALAVLVRFVFCVGHGWWLSVFGSR
jgi:hypothetical protein